MVPCRFPAWHSEFGDEPNGVAYRIIPKRSSNSDSWWGWGGSNALNAPVKTATTGQPSTKCGYDLGYAAIFRPPSRISPFKRLSG